MVNKDILYLFSLLCSGLCLKNGIVYGLTVGNWSLWKKCGVFSRKLLTPLPHYHSALWLNLACSKQELTVKQSIFCSSWVWRKKDEPLTSVVPAEFTLSDDLSPTVCSQHCFISYPSFHFPCYWSLSWKRSSSPPGSQLYGTRYTDTGFRLLWVQALHVMKLLPLLHS